MSKMPVNLEPFSITSEERGDGAYLRVRGEIDIATVPALDEGLRVAQSNGYSGIVVDLEQVTFIDASGLRSLLRAAEQARRSDKSFETVGTPRVVQRVLQITGTARLLRVEAPALVAQREPA